MPERINRNSLGVMVEVGLYSQDAYMGRLMGRPMGRLMGRLHGTATFSNHEKSKKRRMCCISRQKIQTQVIFRVFKHDQIS